MQKPEPSSIPLTPGVYLYKDAKGRIIYVGKARVLRRRVLSYFRPEGLPAKTRAMLSHAESIASLTTTTEKEALLLEALGLAHQQGALAWELRCGESLAQLWQQQGRIQLARDLLGSIHARFSEGFDTQDLLRVRCLLDELQDKRPA